MTIAQDIAAERRRGVTNPQHAAEIQARVEFQRLPRRKRWTRRAPAGWRRY
jgi:hypothetical protein